MKVKSPRQLNAGAQPLLRTLRLILRAFTLADAPAVQQLAGDPEVSATALDLPHPFEDGMAEAWIGTHTEQFAAGTLAAFAIELAETAELCGAAGLMIDAPHRRAELGDWLGSASGGRATRRNPPMP
jgi:[ribosomal protein S5]-alanine N-acetyltransferase